VNIVVTEKRKEDKNVILKFNCSCYSKFIISANAICKPNEYHIGACSFDSIISVTL